MEQSPLLLIIEFICIKKKLVKKGKTAIIQLYSKNKNAIDTPFIILTTPPSLCNFIYTQTCKSN